MSKHKTKQSKPAKKEEVVPPVEEQKVESSEEVVTQGYVDHVVTQEDLDNNPELVGEVAVGDVIQIPAEGPTPEASDEEEVEDSEEVVPPVEPAPEEVPVESERSEKSELDRPIWVDERLWNGLSPERRQRLVNGEEWR